MIRTLLLLTSILCFAAGCGTSDRATRRPVSSGSGSGSAGNEGGTGPTECATPVKGCACPDPGETVECKVIEHFGDYTTCTIGEYKCGDDGVWSPCIGERTTTLP